MKKLLTITVLALCFSLTGCSWFSPYIPPVQQGNILKANEINKLQIGMSKQQVLSALGEPVLVDVFNADMWTYAYTKQVQGGKITRKDLVLRFKNNRLIKIDKRL